MTIYLIRKNNKKSLWVRCVNWNSEQINKYVCFKQSFWNIFYLYIIGQISKTDFGYIQITKDANWAFVFSEYVWFVNWQEEHVFV